MKNSHRHAGYVSHFPSLLAPRWLISPSLGVKTHRGCANGYPRRPRLRVNASKLLRRRLAAAFSPLSRAFSASNRSPIHQEQCGSLAVTMLRCLGHHRSCGARVFKCLAKRERVPLCFVLETHRRFRARKIYGHAVFNLTGIVSCTGLLSHSSHRHGRASLALQLLKSPVACGQKGQRAWIWAYLAIRKFRRIRGRLVALV